MKKLLTIAAVALALGLAAPAHAFHCPADMAKIDKALAKMSNMDPAKMAKVTKLRAQGEAQHKSGQHGKSVNTLAEAMKLLGIK